MISFVLIIMIFNYDGPAVGSAVFHNPKSCQEAADKAMQTNSGMSANKVVAYCVQNLDMNDEK